MQRILIPRADILRWRALARQNRLSALPHSLKTMSILPSVTKMGNYCVCVLSRFQPELHWRNLSTHAQRKKTVIAYRPIRQLKPELSRFSTLTTRIAALGREWVQFVFKSSKKGFQGKLGSKLNIVRRTSLESFYLFAQIVLTKEAVIFIIVSSKAVKYRVVTCF